MIEFTGERVIPGQVPPDLWNEHYGRYLFAARLARGKRVIDLGCGSGYGSDELAHTATSVTALDIDPEAIAYAQHHFQRDNLSYLSASCEDVPLADGSADLVIAFELIEHLQQPDRLLAEAKRLLAPGGQFIVSTPNRTYYATSRTEPNPYHLNEMDQAGFQQALETTFPHVTIFTQNHVSALLFQPLEAPAATSLRLDPHPTGTETAHFYLAVCALTPQIGSPNFLYVPATANVLWERELHIRKLEGELSTKQQWLDQTLATHQTLVEQHRQQLEQLQAANQWAKQRDLQYQEKTQHVAVLEQDLAEVKTHLVGYQQAMAQLEVRHQELENALQASQLQQTEIAAALDAKVAELTRCVELLHQAEAEIDSRTHWALTLDTEKQALQERLLQANNSRWVRLGRALNLGPDLKL
ncbi:MAG: methyltransferase domain-containing protein [Acidobacteria bacterium]|nr:methyltransferase domain-containing protein [Acidobacteriota bacterium]